MAGKQGGSCLSALLQGAPAVFPWLSSVVAPSMLTPALLLLYPYYHLCDISSSQRSRHLLDISATAAPVGYFHPFIQDQVTALQTGSTEKTHTRKTSSWSVTGHFFRKGSRVSFFVFFFFSLSLSPLCVCLLLSSAPTFLYSV